MVWPWQSIVPWDPLALCFLTALPALNNTSWVLAQRTSSWLAESSIINSFPFHGYLLWTIANNVFNPPNFYTIFKFSLIWCISNDFIVWSPQLSSFSAELKQQSRKHLHLMGVCDTELQPWRPLVSCQLTAHQHIPTLTDSTLTAAQGSAMAQSQVAA